MLFPLNPKERDGLWGLINRSDLLNADIILEKGEDDREFEGDVGVVASSIAAEVDIELI